jgi:hypothetical protein
MTDTTDPGPAAEPNLNRRRVPYVLPKTPKCGHAGKVIYDTREAAAKAAGARKRSTRRDTKTPFKCAVCPGWHIGTSGESHRR